MFETCTNLSELNAERIRLTTEGVPLVEVNNAYNEKRQKILTSRKPYVELRKLVPKAYTTKQYSGMPIAGKSDKVGSLILTSKGFLI